MKRFLTAFLTALLVGCGSSAVTPTVGTLLDAPTSLNLTGQAVTAQAAPSVTGETFSVRVRLRGVRPGLSVTDLYVVARDGVWRSAVQSQVTCQGGCTQVAATGPARGLRSGAGVQVVAQLRDAQGRIYLVRDDTVRIK